MFTQQHHNSRSSPMTYLAPGSRPRQCQVWVSSCGAGFQPNQNMVDYSHGILATIEPVSVSCQTGHYYSFHGSHLGETDNYSSGSVPNTFWNYKSQPVGKNFASEYQLGFSMFCDSSISVFSNKVSMTSSGRMATKRDDKEPIMFRGYIELMNQQLQKR